MRCRKPGVAPGACRNPFLALGAAPSRVRIVLVKRSATISGGSPLVLFLLIVLLAGGVAAQESPALTIESVSVDPAAPGPDTLCKLTITVRNDGPDVASQLGFAVSVGGHALPVYGNQLFMVPLAPGESTEIKLYNFWSTETSRPAPAGNELEVRVELLEAQRMSIRTVVEDGEEIEEWEPLGAIDGLPVSASITLAFGG